METNDSILKQIKKYSAHIDRFRARANTHGIWLFIATLGCWGVTEPSIRILAFVMLFFIFFCFFYTVAFQVKSERLKRFTMI